MSHEAHGAHREGKHEYETGWNGGEPPLAMVMLDGSALAANGNLNTWSA